MSGHTPGPWHVWEEHEGIYAGELLVNAPDRIQMVKGTGRGKVAEACELDDDDPSDDSDDFSNAAIAAWNTRTPSRAQVRAEVLREVAKELEDVGLRWGARLVRARAEKEESDNGR